MPEWMKVLIFVALILMIIFAGVIVGSMSQTGKEQLCIEYGYAEYKVIGGEGYCVGVRNGNTVVVPVSSLE